ncbi:MAG TPA: segregation/condensation protein A [Candidatus Paceibacterota bacterium]
MYEVRTQQFSGPLDKLLELIESQKLAIASVNLASVTGDFLNYVEKNQSAMEPAFLSDFLIVATKLVLIKSRTLLPDLTLTPEEEHDIKDLERRLEIYREFSARLSGKTPNQMTASGYLNKLWERQESSRARTFFMSLGERAAFYPGSSVTIATLEAAFQNLTSALQEFLPETGKIKTVMISLEEKIKELINRCREAVKQSFLKLSGKKPRSEIVVMFLAILHLLRDREIEAEQEGQFGDIMINEVKKNDHEKPASAN